jgi:predicted O-linked N-acetylglucosamine transferase (SPINDLY family)
MDQGRADQAENALRKALALDPRHAKASANLGVILQRAEKYAEAETQYRAALEMDAGLAQAWFNLGTLLLDRGRVGDAIDSFRRAVALDASQFLWQSALGHALREAGEAEAALAAERRARELAPEPQLFPSDFKHVPDLASANTSEKVFEAHIVSARLRAAGGVRATYANEPEPARRLRVGYLAPDFNDPTLACLIEPLLENHERKAYEVVCYSDAQIEASDAWRMRDLADLWHATADIDNDRLAERIREDRIDVLVDLAGHSARDKRLAVLAQKPSPIQISWLGFPCAAGLDLMDFRITDRRLCPPGEEGLSAERVLRTRGSRWCFKPRPDAPVPGPVPSVANGRITFGCFRDLSALSRHTIALWAGVLRALPEWRHRSASASRRRG